MDANYPLLQTTVLPSPAEEPDVAEEVVRAIAASRRFLSGRLEVSSAHGIVTLRGRVGSYYQKQVAQAAALTVIGPRELVNEVEVA